MGIAAGAALGGLVLGRSGPTGLVVAAAGLAAVGALVLTVGRITVRRTVVSDNHGAPEAP
ncbi:hypothetical protein SAMN05660657_01994 [Geodermatophilus amargosae]|uniref:Uncharacterized protein n=1 Tax=Geodermatophilus amargosae TaxID=1296565 RepID=A0A1I6ZIJ2_9ACTN|nr:hypothetical protein [Geodermatophilus amargosae]SFT62512.1 hypothetical protein SAMN05660657_01994 [Geodermatophilus amargosae]